MDSRSWTWALTYNLSPVFMFRWQNGFILHPHLFPSFAQSTASILATAQSMYKPGPDRIPRSPLTTNRGWRLWKSDLGWETPGGLGIEPGEYWDLNGIQCHTVLLKHPFALVGLISEVWKWAAIQEDLLVTPGPELGKTAHFYSFWYPLVYFITFFPGKGSGCRVQGTSWWA